MGQEHPPCQCDEPNPSCPRYGWMMGRHHSICRGEGVTPQKRRAYLDLFQGSPRSGPQGRVPLGFREGPAPPPGGPLLAGGGPGTEMKAILQSLGLSESSGCGCQDVARAMDQWGPSGCRLRKDQILAHLRQAQARAGWLAKLKAAGLAVASGLALRLDPLDPAPGLLDEAIRRAEQKEAGRGETPGP